MSLLKGHLRMAFLSLRFKAASISSQVIYFLRSSDSSCFFCSSASSKFLYALSSSSRII